MKAVRQVTGGESRMAEMLKDYMHREIMVSRDLHMDIMASPGKCSICRF